MSDDQMTDKPWPGKESDMPDDWQARRAEALHAALTQILDITLRFREGEGTYYHAVEDVYSLACQALNADAEAGPRELRVRVSTTLDAPPASRPASSTRS